MPKFRYTARDSKGKLVEGVQESDKESTAITLLRQKGLFVTSLKEDKSILKKEITILKPKVKSRDLVSFTRMLATMLSAGMSMDQSLGVMTMQVDNPTFKEVLLAVKRDVEGGTFFSDAIAKHPKIFNELFINLIRAGEASGTMEAVLERIFKYLESSEITKGKVIAALTYPIVLVCVGGVLVLGLVAMIIPRFESIFSEFGGELPILTQIVLGFSRAIRSYFYIWMPALAALIGFLWWYSTINPKGKYQSDKLKISLPLFGQLILKIAIARFSRTLSTLIGSGVAILDALTIVAKTTGNSVIELALNRTREGVRGGKTISEMLQAEGKLFPPMVVQMIEVGQRAGALDDMMAKVADFYDSEVDATMTSVLAAFGPLMLVVMAGMVFIIVLSIFLPIIQLTQYIR